MNIQSVEREGIISSLCLHYVILSAKAELDMLNGLKSLEILTLVRNNPGAARQLVKSTPKPITADTLYDMFTPDLSPAMSNSREKEAQPLNWTNFLGFVEGMFVYCADGSSNNNKTNYCIIMTVGGFGGSVTVFSPENVLACTH